MAKFLSYYLMDKLNDHWLGGPDYPRPSPVYIAIMLTAPTPAGGGVEVSAGDYARVTKVNNDGNFPASGSGVKKNGTIIDFGTLGSDWGLAVGLAHYDAPTGGNFLSYGSLPTPIQLLKEMQFSIPVNGMTLQMQELEA